MASTWLDGTAVPPCSAASRPRTTMAAVRVAITWFGIRKTLIPEQKSQAADTFGAEGAGHGGPGDHPSQSRRAGRARSAAGGPGSARRLGAGAL